MKANIGDKVTVEGVVVNVERDAVLVKTGTYTSWMDSESIKNIEPAPLKLGDEVVYVGGSASRRSYRIKSIYESWAWIACEGSEPWTTSLSLLQRAL